VASETAGTRLDIITGHLRVVKADLTDVDDGDTWAPGLGVIEFATFSNGTSNPSASQVNLRWTNQPGTVTFDTEAEDQSGTITAWGY